MPKTKPFWIIASILLIPLLLVGCSIVIQEPELLPAPTLITPSLTKAPEVTRTDPTITATLFATRELVIPPSPTQFPQTATPLPTETKLPTATPQPSETKPPTATPQPTNTVQPTETIPPTYTPDLIPTMTATTIASILPENEAYRVAFVSAEDSLNVRSGPGIDNEIIGTLPHDKDSIRITRSGEQVSGSTWVQISDNNFSGWVNSRFLTGELSADAFCSNPSALEILTRFERSITNQDGQAFSSLIHPERGLKIHSYWWNPEVLITGDDLRNIFSSNSIYDWGVEDGSGLPISGSFKEVILPQLYEDLIGANSRVCNEISAGPTAGLITLPEGYQNIQYFSYYRSSEEDFAFDWGTWAVGVESWQSEFYISFIVHYNYEL